MTRGSCEGGMLSIVGLFWHIAGLFCHLRLTQNEIWIMWGWHVVYSRSLLIYSRSLFIYSGSLLSYKTDTKRDMDHVRVACCPVVVYMSHVSFLCKSCLVYIYMSHVFYVPLGKWAWHVVWRWTHTHTNTHTHTHTHTYTHPPVYMYILQVCKCQ
jgi:hypothetical protein